MTETSGRPIRLVIVDDHALFRQGLVTLLDAAHGLDVCAEGATGDEAVDLAARFTPDALLLDVDLPGPPAQTTVRTLGRGAPGTAIVIVTVHDDPVLRRQLLAAGATAYVTKAVGIEQLVTDIHLAVRKHRARPTGTAVEPPAPVSGVLSPREHEVMRLVAMAMGNAAIAERLSISEGTVKRHTSSIYAKLGAVSRIDATRKAQLLGLV